MKTSALLLVAFCCPVFEVATFSQESASRFGALDTSKNEQKPMRARKVGFRLSSWRTVHGDKSESTDKIVKTLKRIGCEVKQENHGDHVDVTYRCPFWKSISVQNDRQSKEWQAWLANYKFETVVLNPGKDSVLPEVHVRMLRWRTLQARSNVQAQRLKNTYSLLGCEVRIDSHGDHIDVKFRCKDWCTIGLPNPETAHAWEDWLRKSGFEAQHDHSAD